MPTRLDLLTSLHASDVANSLLSGTLPTALPFETWGVLRLQHEYQRDYPDRTVYQCDRPHALALDSNHITGTSLRPERPHKLVACCIRIASAALSHQACQLSDAILDTGSNLLTFPGTPDTQAATDYRDATKQCRAGGTAICLACPSELLSIAGDSRLDLSNQRASTAPICNRLRHFRHRRCWRTGRLAIFARLSFRHPHARKRWISVPCFSSPTRKRSLSSAIYISLGRRLCSCWLTTYSA